MMPGPGLVKDRDVLQDRWRVSMEGGYAILMQSKVDNSLCPAPLFKLSSTSASRSMLGPMDWRPVTEKR